MASHVYCVCVRVSHVKLQFQYWHVNNNEGDNMCMNKKPNVSDVKSSKVKGCDRNINLFDSNNMFIWSPSGVLSRIYMLWPWFDPKVKRLWPN